MKLVSRLFPSKAGRLSSLQSITIPTPSAVLRANPIHFKRLLASASAEPALSITSAPESLYKHSSGRWLWSEDLRLARRRLYFDVVELARAAAEAVGSRCCVKLEKLGESNFNKAFLLTTDDGREIVAKIPNPNAGRKSFTIASEVATMDYVRSVLSFPVPEVLSWNSSADSAVGAEYILMERCRGTELCKVWDHITDRQKGKLIRKLVSYEAAFTSSTFPMYGSLYYAKDLVAPKREQLVTLGSDKDSGFASFAIGPTTDRAYFDRGGSAANRNLGPWSTLDDYTHAIAHRELTCLEGCSQFPDPQGFFNGPGQYRQTSELKIRVLQEFIKVARYLRPRDKTLSAPILWHTDLHAADIFVDEQNPTEITAIVGWQAVQIAPMFAQAGHSAFLSFDGDLPESCDPSTMRLPDNYQELSEIEQTAARRRRGAQLLWKLYEVYMAYQCNDVRRAMRFGGGLQGTLPGIAGGVFSDGEPYLQELLIQVQEQWDQIVDDPTAEPCPLTFTVEDKVAHAEQLALWAHGVDLMTHFLIDMGADRGWDGSVSHDQYDVKRQNLKSYMQEFIAHHSTNEADRTTWMEVWPFKD